MTARVHAVADGQIVMAAVKIRQTIRNQILENRLMRCGFPYRGVEVSRKDLVYMDARSKL